MKKLLALLTTLLLCISLFSQNKLDNLTDNPSKKDGHFLGKADGKTTADRYMGTYSIAFDFWTLFKEPVYMFYFKWDYKPNAWTGVNGTVTIDKVNRRYSAYPEIFDKMKKRLRPLTDMSDEKLLTVSLNIGFRQGGKTLANVKHEARIDLPDPAGKWNVFALPGSANWEDVFKVNTDILPAFWGTYDSQLRSLTGEKYGELMQKIFKEADNINVKITKISKIRWDASGYEYAIKEKVAEQKAATAVTKTTKASELDELLGSTGYSKEDQAKKKAVQNKGSVDRADAAYDKITNYKDKAALNTAKRLYQQAASDPEAAAYAKNQIAMIDRVLNYKELVIKNDSTKEKKEDETEWVEINGEKWALKNVGAGAPWGKGNAYSYEKACSVCPDGWRLPSKAEFESLIRSGSKYSDEDKGCFFADKKLFMPIDYNQGIYWTSNPTYSLQFAKFSNPNISSHDNYNSFKMRVRCVKK